MLDVFFGGGTHSLHSQHLPFLLSQVHEEFEASSNGLTVDKLIDTFIQSKTTGTEKPG